MENVSKLMELKVQKNVLVGLINNLEKQLDDLKNETRELRHEKWDLEDSPQFDTCAYDKIVVRYERKRGERTRLKHTIWNLEDMVRNINWQITTEMRKMEKELEKEL